MWVRKFVGKTFHKDGILLEATFLRQRSSAVRSLLRTHLLCRWKIDKLTSEFWHRNDSSVTFNPRITTKMFPWKLELYILQNSMNTLLPLFEKNRMFWKQYFFLRITIEQKKEYLWRYSYEFFPHLGGCFEKGVSSNAAVLFQPNYWNITASTLQSFKRDKSGSPTLSLTKWRSRST